MTVTFINALNVPPSREAEFIEKWDRGAEYMRGRDGFVSTSLHRSLSPSYRYQYFTVAVWESADHLLRATATDWWRAFVADFGFGSDVEDFAASPHICEQLR
jgi:heme-degrading monooxygenase HmoA